jgi:UDP-2,3-diacylglucosamine pyrophosphatase LpxH
MRITPMPNLLAMEKKKRALELVVLSDVHLATYGSKAKQLNRYLKSIQPETLVLNGDLFDFWQFSKNYFPAEHMKVRKTLFSLAAKGTKVYYVTGNHDELMRRFTGTSMGNIHIVDKILLNLDGKKAWIFHGDVFDVTMQHSKWLAKLGAIGYGFLIILNRVVNALWWFRGKGKFSLSKTIKSSVSKRLKKTGKFETTAAEIAIQNGYDFVICGHIHEPTIRSVETENGSVLYLNSGDWVENMTSLEYHNKEWSIFEYDKSALRTPSPDDFLEKDLSQKELFDKIALHINESDI